MQARGKPKFLTIYAEGHLWNGCARNWSSLYETLLGSSQQ